MGVEGELGDGGLCEGEDGEEQTRGGGWFGVDSEGYAVGDYIAWFHTNVGHRVW